ncbi:MAG: heparinase II/III-family protein, partial [Gemmatimonadota bacterium]
VVFLCGPQGVAQFNALEKVAPHYASRAFEHGGYYVMRDGWERNSSHVVIDCGPHGSANCGHAHADALSFELALNGRPVFVDPGTYTYTASPHERDAYRSSLVHNTAIIDGLGSSEPDGPFHWRRIAATAVQTWRTDADGRGAYFEGSHNGFEHLSPPVRYRRSIRFEPDAEQLFVIHDEFSSAGPHTATLTFQCAPGVDVRQSGAELFLSRGGEAVCRLSFKSQPDVRGTIELDDSWVSPAYGARAAARRCRYVAACAPGITALTTTISRSTAVAAAQHAAEQAALTEAR